MRTAGLGLRTNFRFCELKKLNCEIFFMKLRLCSVSEVKTPAAVTTKFLWRIISALLRFYVRISKSWWGSYRICGRQRGAIFLRLIIMRRLEQADSGTVKLRIVSHILQRCNAK